MGKDQIISFRLISLGEQGKKETTKPSGWIIQPNFDLVVSFDLKSKSGTGSGIERNKSQIKPHAPRLDFFDPRRPTTPRSQVDCQPVFGLDGYHFLFVIRRLAVSVDPVFKYHRPVTPIF